MLFRNGMNEKICSNIVHVGNEDRRVFRIVIFRVHIFSHHAVPMCPCAGLLMNEIIENGIFRSYSNIRCIQPEIGIGIRENVILQMGSIVQFEKGTNRPHDGKNIQAFDMLWRQLVFRFFRWEQPIEKFTCL